MLFGNGIISSTNRILQNFQEAMIFKGDILNLIFKSSGYHFKSSKKVMIFFSDIIENW